MEGYDDDELSSAKNPSKRHLKQRDPPGSLTVLTALPRGSPVDGGEQTLALTEEHQGLGDFLRGLQQWVSHLLNLDDAAETRGHLNTQDLLLNSHFRPLSSSLPLDAFSLCYQRT